VFGQILVEFLFRLTFGVAAAMALTSARLVTSGFFRVHLWVLLGIQTLAALVLYSARTSDSGQFALALSAAALCYGGAALWLYDRLWAGKLALVLVASCSLAGCLLPVVMASARSPAMQVVDRVTGGLLLGLVTTAMLLGHWYLNTPTMRLEPLQRLLWLLGLAVLLRMVVGASGIWLIATTDSGGLTLRGSAPFIALRWLAGLIGVLSLTGLAWQTLKIPNTQSATGILYAAVVLACIGELTSQLLSAALPYPI
jgi:hypothetical protein